MRTLLLSDETSSTILKKFHEQVKLHSDKLAIIDKTKSLTYFELHSKSKAISNILTEKYFSENVCPVVAVLLPTGLDFISSVIAIFESSRAYAALSVDYPSVKLEAMLEQLGRPLLLTTKSILSATNISYVTDKIILLEDLETLQNPIYCKTGQMQILNQSKQKQISSEADISGKLYTNCTNLACVYFTSGTTGVPKTVPIEHSAFLHCYTGMAKYLQLGPTDESLCILNPAFVLSTQEIWPALISGATLRVPPNNLRYDPGLLRAWIKAQGTVSMICMVASAGEIFFQAEPSEFPQSLRILMLAGEKLQTLPPSTTPFSVYCSYGSSETLAVTITEVSSITSAAVRDAATHTIVGKPFPGVEVYILEEGSLDILENTEQSGEVVVGGLSITRGYLNPDLESSSKFLQLGNGVRVIRTGDLGYFLPDGRLVILNRRDNLIKVNGFRFDLADLESALLQHNSVEKAIAVLEKKDVQKVHLFYKLKTSAETSRNDDLTIPEFLQERLPHYAFPHSITRVDKFPRTSHGKLDKAALLLHLSQIDRVIDPLVTHSEFIISEVWAEVLGLNKSEIGRQDNFFALGGSSLSAIKVIAKLLDRNPEYKIQPFNIFKAPVLKNLAQFLDKINTVVNTDIVDFQAEVLRFSAELKYLTQIPRFNTSSAVNEAVLVTGATGYLGGALVLELLSQTEADIYCIIRSESSDEAESRLHAHLLGFGTILSSEYLSRLHCIPGNIALPRFGLSEMEYKSMASKIDQIFHCAADVHWLKGYKELRAANVQGTLEVIRFAAPEKRKVLHHVSTVDVLDNSTDFKITESKKIASNVDYEMGYTQSKWVAEKLVWIAIEAGLPGIVYRPGIIGSYSHTRIVNSNDFITLLFRVIKEIGAYPDHPWEFPYGSLEFTSKSIFALSQNWEKNLSRAFHNFQNVVSLEDFHDHFERMYLKKVSVAEWKNLVMTSTSGITGQGSEAIEMFKIFVSIPHSKNLTFFDFVFTEHKLNVGNWETQTALTGSEPRVELESRAEQVDNFIGAVYNN